MKLTLHFSPCPNDTFIFDALVNHKIDTKGFQFETALEDVQTLNEQAIQGIPDICKISYGVLPLLIEKYILLTSGGALGKGSGPLLISKKNIPLQNIHEKKIAIPGENTTAHLLFSFLFPQAKNKIFTTFNLIEDMVLIGAVDAGVIIHENRFTYAEKHLVKLADLGETWENETALPIPLGGIVIKRNLPKEVKLNVNKLIRESMEYAFAHHIKHLSEYVQLHAQEMNEDVMRKHIGLYVNDYSKDVGSEGKRAVLKLMKTFNKLHPGHFSELPKANLLFLRK